MKHYLLAIIIVLCIFFIIGLFAMKANAADYELGVDEYGNPLYPDNPLATSDYIVFEDTTEQFSADGEADPDELPSQIDEYEDTKASDPSQIDEKVYQQIIYPEIPKAIAPITPNNTNGFQAVILQLLGSYSPVVIEYSYTNSNGYVSYLREVQPDYSWMISASIFALVLFSLFRIVGVLVKK